MVDDKMHGYASCLEFLGGGDERLAPAASSGQAIGERTHPLRPAPAARIIAFMVSPGARQSGQHHPAPATGRKRAQHRIRAAPRGDAAASTTWPRVRGCPKVAGLAIAVAGRVEDARRLAEDDAACR